MSNITLYTRWLFGILFFVFGLGLFYRAGVAGGAGMLLGILISPHSPKFFGRFTQLNTRVKKIALAIFLFLILSFTTPSATASTTSAAKLETNGGSTKSDVVATASPVPSVLPTPLPSPIHTPVPTPLPSPIPTPLPTQKPTVKPIPTPRPTPIVVKFLEESKPAEQSTAWSCNCKKTCPNMTCAEAQYQLNTCGCSQRDADDDGVACDAQCQ